MAIPPGCCGARAVYPWLVVAQVIREFIGADRGLGRVLIFANGSMDTTLMFAALVWVFVLARVFYAVVTASEKVLLRSHVSQRAESGARASGAGRVVWRWRGLNPAMSRARQFSATASIFTTSISIN